MTQPLRRSEEYPLLIPDSDKPLNQSTVIPMEWNVTCAQKRLSWISRWPQFLSACWMSVVLLTILFVNFYGFGSIYRLQSMIMFKYNDSEPAREVFCHYMVPRDNSVPFRTFTKYLSFMATNYPLLNFNVYLLVDDEPKISYTLPKTSMRYKEYIPKYFAPIGYVSVKNVQNDRDIENIQRKHPNVKVSVLGLSKYMAKTPAQVKWRTLPVAYLPCYMRAYEAWKNGGIGLDLLTQTYRFNALKRINFKLDYILKLHSKSIVLKKYIQELDTINAEEEMQLSTFLFDPLNQILKMTFEMISNYGTLSDYEDVQSIPIVPIKIKRSILSHTFLENIKLNDTKANVSNIETQLANETKGNDSKVFTTAQIKYTSNDINITEGVTKERGYKKNAPNFYKANDIPLLIDGIEAFLQTVDAVNTPVDIKNNRKNYLTMDPDGKIIATYSQHHPTLFKVLYMPQILNLSPRYSISDVIRQSMQNTELYDSMTILNNL